MLSEWMEEEEELVAGGGLNVMCNENELGPNSLFLGHYVAI